MEAFCKWADHNKEWGPVVLRLILGLVFVVHGYGKLTSLDQTIGFFSTLGIPVFLTYLVVAVEFLGGLMLVAGFMTRFASIALAIVMIVAIILVKASKGFSAFEYDLTLLGSLVALMLLGSGKYALESKLKKSKKH